MRARVSSLGVGRSKGRRRTGGKDEQPLLPGLLLDRHGSSGSLLTAQRQQLLAAQETFGNRWVTQRLDEARQQDEATHGWGEQSYTVRAKIPWGPAPAIAAPPTKALVASHDSEDGACKRATVEEEEPGKVEISVTDGINPTLTYGTAITRGNPKLGAGEFGLTSWSAQVRNPTATANAASKTFDVSADVSCPIKWEVHSLGRTHLPGPVSPALHEGNWRTAVSDFTPDLSSDGGRPPRTLFWAKDLTEKHELYHAKDFQKYGQPAFELANTWLAGQSAASEAEAVSTTKKVANQMAGTIRTTYLPRAEHRAYGDGAPDYVTRSFQIQVNGDAELYPPDPSKKK